MAEALCDYVLLFFIYAFLGWCCEVIFAACTGGCFVNRGFLNGPICPIYGFGVVGVVTLLAPLKSSLPLLYLGSFALTTMIEFATGLILEKLFHARWWDYSEKPLNVMGYVCLSFSLVWGLACMAVVLWVHPLIEGAVTALPRRGRVAADAIALAVFALDICATLAVVRKLSDRLKRLSGLGAELHAISDEIGVQISGRALQARQAVMDREEMIGDTRARLMQAFEKREGQVQAWLDGQKNQNSERIAALRSRFDALKARFTQVLEERAFGHRRLINAFPTLRSEHYQDALDSLRAFYRRHAR